MKKIGIKHGRERCKSHHEIYLSPIFSSVKYFLVSISVQGEDNVLVLQTEVILRLVLKIHENDTNIIWLFFKNAYFLKVTWV